LGSSLKRTSVQRIGEFGSTNHEIGFDSTIRVDKSLEEP